MLIPIPTIVLSTLILSAEPNQPTEVIGSAATANGGRKEITVKQPDGTENPFGYIAPTPYIPPKLTNGDTSDTSAPIPPQPISPNTPEVQSLVSQTSTTNPTEMSKNPLDYQNKIENTIYQDGNRLLDVQSIPIEDVNKALTPNIQPTISDYPSW